MLWEAVSDYYSLSATWLINLLRILWIFDFPFKSSIKLRFYLSIRDERTYRPILAIDLSKRIYSSSSIFSGIGVSTNQMLCWISSALGRPSGSLLSNCRKRITAILFIYHLPLELTHSQTGESKVNSFSRI